MDEQELSNMRRHPDYYVWPARTTNQHLINLRGLCCGPRMFQAPGPKDRTWSLGAVMQGWPEAHPDAAGFFVRRKLTTLPEFQPTV